MKIEIDEKVDDLEVDDFIFLNKIKKNKKIELEDLKEKIKSDVSRFEKNEYEFRNIERYMNTIHSLIDSKEFNGSQSKHETFSYRLKFSYLLGYDIFESSSETRCLTRKLFLYVGEHLESKYNIFDLNLSEIRKANLNIDFDRKLYEVLERKKKEEPFISVSRENIIKELYSKINRTKHNKKMEFVLRFNAIKDLETILEDKEIIKALSKYNLEYKIIKHGEKDIYLCVIEKKYRGGINKQKSIKIIKDIENKDIAFVEVMKKSCIIDKLEKIFIEKFKDYEKIDGNLRFKYEYYNDIEPVDLNDILEERISNY